MTIGAGDLRERIAFDQRVELDDGAGNTVGDWAEQFTVAARVLPLKGSEAVQAARLAGQQPVVITVRMSRQARQIGPEWRARNTRTSAVYAITAPPANMDERGQFLDILATAGRAA
jgi:SPP1 family predicted phage head-tail adaptor